MVFILSIKISSSDHICSISELSTITVDTSESNPMFSENLTLEEILFHILYFDIVLYKKGVFLVWLLGGGVLSSNWISLILVYPPSSVIFFFKSDVGKVSHFRLNLSSLDILFKIGPLKIRMISETNMKWVQNVSGGFSLFVD